MYLYARVLKYERTEYGKSIRKMYEAKMLNRKIPRNEMRTIIPRSDENTNTLTTVLKDNYILEYAVKDEHKNESN